jgi:TM2 domain-containing membrane protein YozV
MGMTNQPARDQDFIEDANVSDKNRLLALLLAFFFGVFGAHRFYVGKTGTAVVMLLLDLTLVGFAVTGVWSLIDCLFIALGEFTDSDGRKILDWNL